MALSFENRGEIAIDGNRAEINPTRPTPQNVGWEIGGTAAIQDPDVIIGSS